MLAIIAYRSAKGNAGCKPEPIEFGEALAIAIGILKNQGKLTYRHENNMFEFSDTMYSYSVAKTQFIEALDSEIRRLDTVAERVENISYPYWGKYSINSMFMH